MKSAIELAMEKASKGMKEDAPLTDGQKRDIAEERSRAKALIAQEEIMFAGRAEGLPDGEEKGVLGRELARSIRKIEEEMERNIEKIRSGANRR